MRMTKFLSAAVVAVCAGGLCIAAAQQTFNHRVKCDSAAALGRYTTAMETESVIA